MTSVERAIGLLRAVNRCDGTLSALSRETGLPVATVSRLMATLEMTGAAVRSDKRYRLGPVIAELANSDAAAVDVLAVANPHLNDLAERTNETAGIAQRIDFGYVHLGQVATEHDVTVKDWTGFHNAAHAGCIGFVLMSHWSKDEIDRYLDRELEAFSPKTMTDPAAIRDRLALVRSQGWLVTTDEYAQGVTSVAAPVFDRNGEVMASLYAHGPSYRFPPRGGQPTVGRLVRQRAEAISSALGHRRAA